MTASTGAHRRGRRSERGASALLVALLSIVLMGVLAFVTDFGFAYANERRIQNGADAAALAAGRKIAISAPAGSSCASIASTNLSSTRAYASTVFGRNVGSGATLDSGTAGYNLTCETVQGTPGVLVVTVVGRQDSPTFFGGIFGKNAVTVVQRSRVVVGALGSAVGLRPFAICATYANAVRASPGTTFVVPVTNTTVGSSTGGSTSNGNGSSGNGSGGNGGGGNGGGGNGNGNGSGSSGTGTSGGATCGAAAGNWSTLDFDGGSNAATDVRRWIEKGYEKPVDLDPDAAIPGSPGFGVNSASTELNVMFTLQDVVLPVYSPLSGNGANASYAITGFLSVTPCRYKINNKTGPAPALVNPGCDPLPLVVPDDYIQLRFSAFIPIGSLNLDCSLGDVTCDGGARTAMLAD